MTEEMRWNRDIQHKKLRASYDHINGSHPSADSVSNKRLRKLDAKEISSTKSRGLAMII